MALTNHETQQNSENTACKNPVLSYSGKGKVMDIRLHAPGLVCCAGNDRDSLNAAVNNGDSRGILPVIVPSPQGEDRPFLAGRIQNLPPLSPRFSDLPADSRLLRIISVSLEQIRSDVEAAISAYGADRVGICAGSCDNGSEFSLPAHRAFFSGGTFPSNYNIRFQSASFIAEFIAEYFGIRGPCLTVATACASGAGAIIKGAQFIKSGICDAVIAGGADLVSDTVLLGFSALEAVSDEICNPFSINRKGITLGEGAAFFVLTGEDEDASGRSTGNGQGNANAEINLQDNTAINLLGWGESADAHHMTAPRPDGSGAAAAMRQALTHAGIDCGKVDYINLHGTATPLNDSMEALALQNVFGGKIPPVSSTKPVTGHTLGAAGSLELAICWIKLSESEVSGVQLPVHNWDNQQDPEIPALPFCEKGTRASLNICMSNSFAFGGCNTSLIIGRRDND